MRSDPEIMHFNGPTCGRVIVCPTSPHDHHPLPSCLLPHLAPPHPSTCQILKVHYVGTEIFPRAVPPPVPPPLNYPTFRCSSFPVTVAADGMAPPSALTMI